MRLMALGGVLALGGLVMASQAIEVKLRYTLVPATITSAEQDCFLKNGEGDKIVEAESNDLAYFPCEEAPYVAAEYEMGEGAVQTRTVFEYDYVSPVDGQTYTGTIERNNAAEDMVVGKQIEVYASDDNPEESRTTRGNFFLDDTGV